MKVLLDENLDHALRPLLAPHEVFTAVYMGWAGRKNGELIQAADETGFDVLLTGDQSLGNEQNFTGRRLAVVALSAIELPVLRESIAAIVAAIGEATPGSFRTVECGSFNRRRPRKG